MLPFSFSDNGYLASMVFSEERLKLHLHWIYLGTLDHRHPLGFLFTESLWPLQARLLACNNAI